MKEPVQIYSLGKSKEDALSTLTEDSKQRNKDFRPANTPDLALFTDDHEINLLTTYQNVLLWAGCLIKNGRLLDKFFDKLLDQVTVAGDSFYNSKEPIQSVLNNLLAQRDSLRNFEIDVGEFMNIAGIIDHSQQLKVVSVVSELLGAVSRTFERVFDLCILKLKSISNARVSTTNMMISSTALIIAILTFIYSLFWKT